MVPARPDKMAPKKPPTCFFLRIFFLVERLTFLSMRSCSCFLFLANFLMRVGVRRMFPLNALKKISEQAAISSLVARSINFLISPGRFRRLTKTRRKSASLFVDDVFFCCFFGAIVNNLFHTHRSPRDLVIARIART